MPKNVFLFYFGVETCLMSFYMSISFLQTHTESWNVTVHSKSLQEVEQSASWMYTREYEHARGGGRVTGHWI